MAIREWPDRDFIAEVEESFPDQGIANVEEARVGPAVPIKLFAAMLCKWLTSSLEQRAAVHSPSAFENLTLLISLAAIWRGLT